jgi:hypothetical protein
MVELKVLQGGSREPRMDSCAMCRFSRLQYTVMRCDAFAGEHAVLIRYAHQIKCPGYVERRRVVPAVRETRPPGWLKRWVLRFLRWVW